MSTTRPVTTDLVPAARADRPRSPDVLALDIPKLPPLARALFLAAHLLAVAVMVIAAVGWMHTRHPVFPAVGALNAISLAVSLAMRLHQGRRFMR